VNSAVELQLVQAVFELQAVQPVRKALHSAHADPFSV
jgi:hypothetical protein